PHRPEELSWCAPAERGRVRGAGAARRAGRFSGAAPADRVPPRRHAVRPQSPDPAFAHRLLRLGGAEAAPASAQAVAGAGGSAAAAALLRRALRLTDSR